jgi:lysophospholipase L1-like esterase
MPQPTPETFPVEDGQTLVFIGDSITDTGRRGDHTPLGWGYVRMAVDLVTARYPEREITFHNRGISGNTTDDLVGRWTDDLVALEPDWVSLMVGINDLGRWFKPGHQDHVPPDRYRANYERLLERTRDEAGARLVLMEPFYISAETDEATHEGTVLRMLPAYLDVVREMADAFDASLVPMHGVFQRQIRYRPADHFCPEPVHPNPTGHRVIAHAWLQAMGW